MRNQLTTALGELCQRHLLVEKWLLAPSRRVAHQWQETVVRSGQAVVNLQVKTLQSLAIELAAAEMSRRQVRLVPRPMSLLLMQSVLSEPPAPGFTYFRGIKPDTSTATAMLSAVEALRVAGVGSESLIAGRLEVPAKATDMRWIVEQYSAALTAQKLIDFADVVRIAIERLHGEPSCLGSETRVFVPADLDVQGLWTQLLKAMPTGQVDRIPVDEPVLPGESRKADSDRARLAWLLQPAEAPPPFADDTVRLVRAVGEINEVREVLRACAAEGLPLDSVELLRTDRETYVPLIYELLMSIEGVCDDQPDHLPVTFSEGIPCRYSRPGRALAGWLEWVRHDGPQATLVRMLRDGLLDLPKSDQSSLHAGRLATRLRGLGIGFGWSRYAEQFVVRLRGLEQQAANDRSRDEDEEDEDRARRAARRDHERTELCGLQQLIAGLLPLVPRAGDDPRKILELTRGFLETRARCVTELDQFAGRQLIEEIRGLEQWLGLAPSLAGFDVFQWLTELPQRVRVMGSGPRPGCLHVDSVFTGGHSGRSRTFVVGLDDGRFPGGGRQDPILLDSERQQLSPHLSHAGQRLEETIRGFVRLLARLRGRVTLSYPCRNLDRDQELFPSSLMLAAFRVVSGQQHADQNDLDRTLPRPASFAAVDPATALSRSDWLLSQVVRLAGSESTAGVDRRVVSASGGRSICDAAATQQSAHSV